MLDAHRFPATGDESVRALRSAFAIADHGYDDSEDDSGDAGAQDPSGPKPRDVLAELRDDDHLHVDLRVTDALDAVGVDDPAEARRTRAVIDGLVVAVCLGRLSPADAVAAVDHHLGTFGGRARVTA